MKKIVYLFTVLLLVAGCGGSVGGDNTEVDNEQGPTAGNLLGCAENILQMDEEGTVCFQNGELPDGRVRSTALSGNGVSFSPNGTFEQSADECHFSGKYVFTSTNCFCATYSVLQDTVYCGVSGADNQTLCSQCFTATN